MKIVIPGGTGQVGTLLARAFVADGHEVVVLSRSPGKASWRMVWWDGQTVSDWAAEIDGAYAVINLAGRSVNCRYTARNRRLIRESRINSTRAVGQAVAGATRPPRVWLQASTATIYAHRYDAPNDEATGLVGGSERGTPDAWRFSIDVAQSWEQAANEVIVPQTRKVLLRSGMIMSPDPGGVFAALLGLVRWKRRRSPVRFLDSRPGFYHGCLLADRPSRVGGAGQRRFAEPSAQRRVHAHPASRMGDRLWFTRHKVDARNRRLLHADRNRVDPEKSTRGPESIVAVGFRFPVADMVRSGCRPVPSLA